MGIELHRITIELPKRVYDRLLWCQTELGAGSKIEVIRHAINDYEAALRARSTEPTTSTR